MRKVPGWVIQIGLRVLEAILSGLLKLVSKKGTAEI